MIVQRQVDEFTIEEAKELVEMCVASDRRDGFEFFMLVNKSAALFKNGEKFGLVLGLQDGVQAAALEFEWIVLRSNVVLYETTLAVT